ncbi:MAG: FeoB-associated Cys-rich membrane protein [Bacillota bacterium]|nr:FeoB-associated Cys-rich membrane protein [Bacillota bacterium]
MGEWLAENLGTIVVSVLLLAAVTAIVIHLVRNKRKGKPSCGYACQGCAMNGQCHKH